MKRLIVFVLLLMPLQIFAQGLGFMAEEGKLKWQRVYTTELDSTAIVQAAATNPALEEITAVPGGFRCKIAKHYADFKGAGYSRGRVPMYLLLYEYQAVAIVQIKEARYRVTVERIVFEDSSKGSDRREAIETWAVNGSGALRDAYTDGVAGMVMDYDLGGIFEFAPLKEDEW